MAQGRSQSADPKKFATRGVTSPADMRNARQVHVSAFPDPDAACENTDASPGSSGLVMVAIERVGNATGRLQAASNELSLNLDRLLSSVPETAGQANGNDLPSGTVHVLHYQLSMLERAVDYLTGEVDRITRL